MWTALRQAVENLKLIPGLLKDVNDILDAIRALQLEIRGYGDRLKDVAGNVTEVRSVVDNIRKKVDSIRLPFT